MRSVTSSVPDRSNLLWLFISIDMQRVVYCLNSCQIILIRYVYQSLTLVVRLRDQLMFIVAGYLQLYCYEVTFTTCL